MSDIDNQRAYQRGYVKGRAFDNKYNDELQTALTEMQQRAERAEAGIGIGQCRKCDLWRRNGDALWGTCLLSEAIVGLDWPWRGSPDQAIHTKQNFGCIRFVEKT